ncbi:helix-turn-helix domain-containing protein [Methanobrevibacter sp.]|uniref:helix-turn-helix domain-containing protein n=1 Tax=Methanobrevibacter sp. TaxID=66852 RepID=UPI00388D1C98
MENLDFWNRVKALIKENKITQEMLANKAGISFNNLKQQIFYNRYPTADEAVKIAQVLNTTVEYLVTGKPIIDEEFKQAYKDELIKTLTNVLK